MIAALLDPRAYPHPVERVECIETHISWVLLTGSVAYKIKKPVNLGFVDFSTVQRRRWYCQEELRLNRRLAPDLYLGLSPIHGPVERASFQGYGEPIELAVRMRQFPQSALLPAVLERGGPSLSQVEGLADDLAAFHAGAAHAEASSPHGEPESVREPAMANLVVLEGHDAVRLSMFPLREWTQTSYQQLKPCFARRKRLGRIRECHGDLHLGNMLLEGNRIQVFDCLEFSPALRWIDVISDMAFLVMDLEHRGRPDLGAGLLNRWLGQGGDFAGLLTWRWYRLYRALVRAKVCALRLQQGELAAAEATALDLELRRYLDGADGCTREASEGLVITHGISGSGKSHWSRQLCLQKGWIHLSSDQERKRLFGRWGHSDAPPLGGDPYRPEVTEMLFGDHLLACADSGLEAGQTVVVDATFLRLRHRELFRDLARRRGVPFLILDCGRSADLAHRRLLERLRQGRDASDADAAVLERQLQEREVLEAGERTECLVVQPGQTIESLTAELRARLARSADD
jgi:aminoglycoside phosphotransferase family enzyme/predicted kinase